VGYNQFAVILRVGVGLLVVDAIAVIVLRILMRQDYRGAGVWSFVCTFPLSTIVWPLGAILFGGASGAVCAFLANAPLIVLSYRRKAVLFCRVCLVALAVVVYPRYLGAASPRDRIIGDRANLVSLHGFCTAYLHKHGHWPPDLKALEGDFPEAASVLRSPGGYGELMLSVAGPLRLPGSGRSRVEGEYPRLERDGHDYLYVPPEEGAEATDIVLMTRPRTLWKNTINFVQKRGVAGTWPQRVWRNKHVALRRFEKALAEANGPHPRPDGTIP